MKKILTAALIFCGALTASAQSKGDVRFGLTGGMNIANITNQHSDYRIGFNVGARLEYGFTNNVYLGTGLLFTQKGYEYELSVDGFKYEDKANPLYLQIPIHIGYHHNFGNGIGIFGETGPYLAFGIAGKVKVKGDTEIGYVEEKTDFFGDDACNVFDMGWGLRAGLNVNQFQIHLGYEYGITKVLDKSDFHNSNFSIGVSYFF